MRVGWAGTPGVALGVEIAPPGSVFICLCLLSWFIVDPSRRSGGDRRYEPGMSEMNLRPTLTKHVGATLTMPPAQ